MRGVREEMREERREEVQPVESGEAWKQAEGNQHTTKEEQCGMQRAARITFRDWNICGGLVRGGWGWKRGFLQVKVLFVHAIRSPYNYV